MNIQKELISNTVCAEQCPFGANQPCQKPQLVHAYRIRFSDQSSKVVRHHPDQVPVDQQSDYLGDLGQLRIDILGCEDQARRRIVQ